MPDLTSPAIKYAVENRERFISELEDFITIATVSTDPGYQAEVQLGAQWVAGYLGMLGFENIEVFPEPPSHPIVYGDYLHAGPEAPTVLIYGHYDVQPAEPLDKWTYPPFDPTQVNETLYGRGATDMKGQVVATMKAVEAVKNTSGLPVNIKFMIEGAEESGSPNLEDFIAENKELLACDVVLNPDTGMLSSEHPTITYGLRGLVYFELRIFGPSQDLHSGMFGGVVHNPAQALTELIAAMHDAEGRVTLPGFYDSVIPLNTEEREELSRLPMNADFYLENTGVSELWGEQGYTPVERTGGRPTLEVNGIYSGFIEAGAKTVLPAYALAKLSCRLVPDQTPEEVHQQMVAYLKKNTPPSVRWELDILGSGNPSISNRHSSGVLAMSAALETVWGSRPIFKREGGSVPVVDLFQRHLAVDTINTGFSLPDDNMHGPNEKLDLTTWFRGIQATIHFLYNLKA